MEKRILKGTQVGIATPKRQRHNSPIDIKKKKKSAYEKEDKKIRIADVREKRARFAKRFSANGPFRTAAILPF